MRVLLAALLLAGVAVPAQAEEVTVRFTGQLNYVHYSNDPFGVPDINGPLTPGLDYVYDLTFDTAIGSLAVVPGYSQLSGIGYAIGPIRRWSLTVNGVTDNAVRLDTDLYNNTVARSGNQSAGAWSISFDGGFGNQKYWAASINATSYAPNSHILTDPFVNQNVIGTASFWHYQARGDGSFSHLYWLAADVRSAQLVVPNGVPEPASWALMIAGFGLAGTAARRAPSGKLRAA
ncbi:PEPxxWA-CTERM sorting domain-containing protein [Sphingomonas sp. ID1715]|uniref:PEPxxWA-CTERM sorting domain-containing protein n=1 Tax=Sphingomonas sp. ID1715 TaxID=1656898 RepID=UPI001C2C34BA|nr:PEPxxWA-CTERM sorting domain-containing protein [Sphingomonas sp. ID1715]